MNVQRKLASSLPTSFVWFLDFCDFKMISFHTSLIWNQKICNISFQSKHQVFSEKPGTWEKWILKNLENSWMQKKGRPHNIIIIYYNTKILQEEACKQAIWKNSYWGFLGRQKIRLRLRVKMNWKAINK